MPWLRTNFATLVIFSLLAMGAASDTATAAAPSNFQAKHHSVFWLPKLSDTFELQLTGALAIKVSTNIYDIDLFDNSSIQITQLKQQKRKIVCYFSAGSGEDWRPDFAKFSKTDLGKPLQGWPGENWLDIRSKNVRKIMLDRILFAKHKGCDGIDPDNVDGYTNSTGFPISTSNQLDYNRFLSRQAHAHGLAIGLKNDIAQIASLVSDFDFAVNEQCYEFAECDAYQEFILRNKPVLNVEYQERYVSNTDRAFDELCAKSRIKRFHTLVLPYLLDASFRKSCDN